MPNVKYDSPLTAAEETGSSKPYYEQFPSIVPEAGKVYTRAKGTWQETDYTILCVIDGVALGVSNGSFVKNHCLFHAEGVKAGWKYDDARPLYRLQEKS